MNIWRKDKSSQNVTLQRILDHLQAFGFRRGIIDTDDLPLVTIGAAWLVSVTLEGKDVIKLEVPG